MKRTSADQPLTPDDVAERLDKAALRVLRIMYDIRENGGPELLAQVRSSRYLTNAVNALAAELAMDDWNIEPQSLRPE